MVGVKGEGGSSKRAAGRTGVLVLGMHRSGTSALSRFLNLLGCDLPKTLLGGDTSNETGHWESLPIVRLNDRILESAGSNWSDWMPFNPGWYSSPKAAEFKEEALTLLDEQFGRSGLFVLKDPRICRFAPFWIEVLQAAKVRPVAVMQLRNPLEVADSLSRRNGFDPAYGQLLWLRHVLEAEATTREIARYRTSYDILLKNWPRVAAESQDALDVSWPRLSLRTGGEIDAFLTGQLRHHSKSPGSVLDNSLLSGWLRETFATLNRWAENGEASEDHATLDRIRAELDAASPAFSQIISVGMDAAEKTKALEATLKTSQEKLSAAQSAVEAKQAQIQSLEQEQLANLRAEAQSHRAALDEARGQLSHLQSELAQRRAEADDATRQLQELQQRFDAERQRHTQELLDERQRHDKELTEHRASTDKELQSLRRQKDEADGRLAERFGEIAALTRLLSERERQAQLAEKKAAQLQAISTVLLNGSGSRSLKSRMGALMPTAIRLKKQMSRLKSAQIFDAKAYLEANPDVAEAGMDPLRHYLNHGIDEGRKLQRTSADHAQGE